MLCSAVSRGGGSSRSLDKGGGVSLPKNLFLVWSKNKGGPGPPLDPHCYYKIPQACKHLHHVKVV